MKNLFEFLVVLLIGLGSSAAFLGNALGGYWYSKKHKSKATNQK